jgi:hypothetical protein
MMYMSTGARQFAGLPSSPLSTPPPLVLPPNELLPLGIPLDEPVPLEPSSVAFSEPQATTIAALEAKTPTIKRRARIRTSISRVSAVARSAKGAASRATCGYHVRTHDRVAFLARRQGVTSISAETVTALP